MNTHTTCIIETFGGYAYGDASLNSYYKFGVNFRTNNVADFYEIHKKDGNRLKLGYRMDGVDNSVLGLIVWAGAATAITILATGDNYLYFTVLESIPSDTTWL